MAQISLYFRTQFNTKTSLQPEQINADLDNNLLNNLKKQVEKKCMDIGIVIKVNRIIDYDYGVISDANYMAVTVYDVKYECMVCSLTKNLEIICKVENIITGFYVAKNGPVVVAIQTIDTTQNFEMVNQQIIYTKTGNPVKKGDYLKVSIISIKNNLGEKEIVTMCRLINMATPEEIEKYNQDQSIINGTIDDEEKEFI